MLGTLQKKYSPTKLKKSVGTTCAEVNKIDMVDYLDFISFQAIKIMANDHWYNSPSEMKRTNHLRSTEAKMAGMITEWGKKVT